MMYLLTDHSGLNKFSGDEDPNFQTVCAIKEATSIVSRITMVWEMIWSVSVIDMPDF